MATHVYQQPSQFPRKDRRHFHIRNSSHKPYKNRVLWIQNNTSIKGSGKLHHSCTHHKASIVTLTTRTHVHISLGFNLIAFCIHKLKGKIVRLRPQLITTTQAQGAQARAGLAAPHGGRLHTQHNLWSLDVAQFARSPNPCHSSAFRKPRAVITTLPSNCKDSLRFHQPFHCHTALSAQDNEPEGSAAPSTAV